METIEARSAEVNDLSKVHFIPSAGVPDTAVVPRTARILLMWRWLTAHAEFSLTVLVPTIAAILYYGLIASDIYTSEARFIVRSSERPAETGLLGNFLQSTGISHSEDDTYAVRDFILSRDALRELDAKLGIRKLYVDRNGDLFSRFPTLDRDRSFEAFFKYYLKHVSVEYDPATSISVLTVRAFRADDAYRITSSLLGMSEHLVNGLNERSRNDLIRFAQDEVKAGEARVRETSLAMLAYRSEKGVFEPDKQAGIQLEGVAKLDGELVSTEAELAQLRKLSPDNPQIPGLESRAETLRAAIADEASKVTSAKGSLSARAPEFERLLLESTFADKQLGAAMAELQSTQSEAARQQLYLERLVQPSLPDRALEPRRIRSIFSVFAVGMIAWGVLTLIVASVREHAD